MVTSSLLHLKSDAFGSKIAPSATTLTASSSSVANRGAHKTLAALIFQAHNGLKCHPMRSNFLSDIFILHVMPKPWNHWFYFGTTHTFRCSQAHFHLFSLKNRHLPGGDIVTPDPYWASKSPLFGPPVLTRL